MIHYRLSQGNKASHYIDVDLHIDAVKEAQLLVQLPSWRPGRYELGNFAKNVRQLTVSDKNGKALSYTKQNKDLWQIDTQGASEVHVRYSYFASELNAGSSFSDETQLYLNPVNLCMYVPGRMMEEHRLTMDLPATYKVATSLKRLEQHVFSASDFHELADSPVIASPTLQTESYEVQGLTFYLHFQGECRPDWAKIKEHFVRFSEQQLRFYGDAPFKEYHFLFQILPHKFYHGVEHLSSTVIALGPGYAINQGAGYEALLGVSSHELFHAWNIKTIRPAEMEPYDYTRENYARTGYVYEGFTTYYGDLILRSSGVFSDEEYFDTLEERLNKHFHNYGRFHLSVAHSSWETWLDGYVPGAPWRKTSIYDEGCLVAFMLDTLILQATDNARSLRDVCRMLYESFGKQHKGYTEQDVIAVVEQVSGRSFADFFERYVYGTADFTGQLQACFDYLGLEMRQHPSAIISERDFGFRSTESGHFRKLSHIAPGSPADAAQLELGDEVVAVNGFSLKNDMNEWLHYFINEHHIELLVSSAGKMKTLGLTKQQETSYFDVVKIVRLKNATTAQSRAFQAWVSA